MPAQGKPTANTPRIASGHTTLASYLPHCYIPTVHLITLKWIEDPNYMPTLCELIEDFQIHWGVRISEILKLEPEDLLPDDIVHVHASKFSNDRYIHDPEWIAAVRQYMILIPGQPIFDISYTQYWSWLKKRWEFYIPEGHENRRTTHMFRQDLIRNLYNEGWSIEEIAEFIGHKDPRSTQGYL